jgi:hypothetical protein
MPFRNIVWFNESDRRSQKIEFCFKKVVSVNQTDSFCGKFNFYF